MMGLLKTYAYVVAAAPAITTALLWQFMDFEERGFAVTATIFIWLIVTGLLFWVQSDQEGEE